MKFITLTYALLSLITSAFAKEERPNIIFIFSDDWGWEDLSCHNHPYIKTPNIDRIAKEGRDFTRFTVASPVCSPSRTAVMTGQFPSRQLVDGHFAWADSNEKRGMPDWVSTDAPSLPRMLQSAGYLTAHYGKWHLSNEMIPDSPSVAEYGYDDYAAFNCSGIQMPYDRDIDHSIAFIKRATKEEKPFFINLWIHEPHTPFHVIPKYRQMFPEVLNDSDNIYAATLAYADERIGQLLDYLDEQKIAENTIVIFSSDNGPARSTNKDRDAIAKMMYDPATGMGFGIDAARGTTGGRKGYKGSLHEGGLNVPFLVRWPAKIKPGTVDNDTFITAVDLLPTFCNLAKAKLPEGYVSDGLDYSEALLGTPIPKREKSIFSRYVASPKKAEHWASLTAITEGYKYLANPKIDRVELYNLVNDPKEQTNIADKHPELITKFENDIKAWQDSLPKELTGNVFSKLRNDPEALKKSKEPYFLYK